MNAYAVFLRHVLHGWALWIARGRPAGRGRPAHLVGDVPHPGQPRRAAGRLPRGKRTESTYASRTMRWSGVILLLFVVYHLMHFTFGNVHPSFIDGDVYHNFVVGFRNVWVSLFYILAMLALGLHLYHGVWSMFQTLGLSPSALQPLGARRRLDLRGGRRDRQHLLPLAVLAGLVK